VTTATPTRPDELEDLLSDPARAHKLVDEGKLSDVVAEYARAVHAKDKDLSAQIKEQTTTILAELLEVDRKEAAERLNLAPKVSPDKGASHNRRAPGAALDNVYGGGSAEFLQAIWHGNRVLPNREDLQAKQAEASRIQNAFSSLTPGDGGFLIPETLRSEILSLSLEMSIVRPRATVIPMESARVPIPTLDDTSHASSVYGGIIGYWTEEAAALTETSASFGRAVLDAKKLTAYSELPNELLADASALGGFFEQKFPEAVAFFEDYAFVNGSGAGEPLGFLNADAAVSVTKESGQAANTIVWENIVKCYGRMLPASLGKAVWVANIETFQQLATMALSVGTGGSAIWLNNGSEGPPMTILGRPVIFTEKVSALSSAGDINFVDLSYYLIGDRQAIQVSTSPHYKFANDKTAFRVVERVDGRPWLGSALTPKAGSATLSPFVKIGAR
jgi:HK97 family phage major capsid protein